MKENEKSIVLTEIKEMMRKEATVQVQNPPEQFLSSIFVKTCHRPVIKLKENVEFNR